MSGGKLLVEDFKERVAFYKKTRDFPAIKGVSYLSVHLRFGTVSIRQLFQLALESFSEGSETWLSELIWREFYFQIVLVLPEGAIRIVGKHVFQVTLRIVQFKCQFLQGG